MPAPNIIQFSIEEAYRNKLANLAIGGESIGLVVKRLIIEILDKDEQSIETIDTTIGSRIDTLEQSIETIDTTIGSRIDTLEQSIKQSIDTILSRLDTLEQSREPLSNRTQKPNHLSDAAVAKMIGVAPGTPARWRLGQRKMSDEVIEKLGDLGIALQDGSWMKI